jgi:peptidase E
MNIVAIGGGGFSESPDNLALEQYCLNLCEVAVPRVLFISTASGDADGYTARFFNAFSRLNCKTGSLSLFRPPPGDLSEYVNSYNLVYVGGGNTRSMLALWKEWSLDSILRKAWQNGVVLSGVSAGAICWFEWGITDSVPGRFYPLECLGYITGAACPHWNSEGARQPVVRSLVKDRTLQSCFGIENDTALHFKGQELHKTISLSSERDVFQIFLNGTGTLSESSVRPKSVLAGT